MSIRHMKKRNTRFPLLLFLCTEQFTDTNLFTFLQDRAALHLNMQNVGYIYDLLIYICFPLCAHILYFDAAKFSIKQFSFIYLTVSVVRQRNEYEIVNEMWPIKTTCSSHFQDVNLHKDPDNRAIVWWNQIHIW